VCGESGSVDEEHVGAWKTGVLPSLLTEYHPKNVFNAGDCGLFSRYSHTKCMLVKVKAVMGTRGVKTELLCLYVQILMDVKRCDCL
jgi:hypothetical protein